jgi:TatD DNase family protein
MFHHPLYIDTHTHRFIQDLAVNQVSIHNLFSDDKALMTCATFPEKLFSVGLHPWHLQTTVIDEALSIVETAFRFKNVIAVGETGLDKAIITDFEWQKKVFCRHIALSEKYQKPLIIHCVRAYNEVLAIKKQLKPKQTWIFHGFAANKQIAKNCLDAGCYLSFGAILCNETAKATQFFAHEMPLTQLFLETDSTESIKEKLPKELPKDIINIYQQAAKLKNIAIESLQKQMMTNFNTIFKQI